MRRCRFLLILTACVVLLIGILTNCFSAATGTVPATGDLRLTILFDNTAFDEQLKADWGFAALVEYGNHMVELWVRP